MFLDLRKAKVPNENFPHLCRDYLEVVSDSHALLDDVIKLTGFLLADEKLACLFDVFLVVDDSLVS